MKAEDLFVSIHHEAMTGIDTISSLAEAEALHKKLLEVRQIFFSKTQLGVMAHYRGEGFYGWDIRPGIFRPPLKITDPSVGKGLEQKAIEEFESTIRNKVGPHALRTIFNSQKYGKDWDLLFQAQHAGIRTTLTDWSAEVTTGLFFATEESQDPAIETADAQLWYYMVPECLILGDNDYPVRDTFYDMNPFKMPFSYLINASTYLPEIDKRIFEYRMFRQKGRFVMSASQICNIPLNKQEYIDQFIFRLRIPQQFKNPIREQLGKRKMTRDELYIEETKQSRQLITDINTSVFAEH